MRTVCRNAHALIAGDVFLKMDLLASSSSYASLNNLTWFLIYFWIDEASHRIQK
jgi:hypothetical protein